MLMASEHRKTRSRKSQCEHGELVVQLTKELMGTDDVTATLRAHFGISVHQEVGKAGTQNQNLLRVREAP